MTVLGSTERARVCAQWMRKNFEACGFTKAQLQAAVDATDDWIEANSASYNSALPVGFRTTASATQKTLLFVYVAMRRRGLLWAEEDG